ncbi:hypothetical protein [Pseudotabrizicola formosa]|uniref:hypothetical protein n=1 Tax=Pseudotabrizicola formosa TaxID=2030009 RepID=UPI000CD227D1|nr:hypothetical protein [Pseudotabrizicola formosa]
MVLRLIMRLRRLVLIALLAVGLAVSGFGHRAPMAQDAQLEALLLSGFTMADLCTPSGSDEAASAVPCLACTPSGPVLIPALGCMLRPADVQVLAAVFAPRERRTVASVHDPAHAPRAPPLA